MADGPSVPTARGTAGTHQTALANQSEKFPKEGATHCSKYHGLGYFWGSGLFGLFF